MAYENEVRPTPTQRHVERTSYTDSGSYVFPVLAVLIVIGLGAWFAASYNTDKAPTSPPTTIERTTPAPSVPAPSLPAPTPSPAPTTPK